MGHFYDTSRLNHPKLLWVQWCLLIKWQTIFSLQCVGHSIKSTQADYLMMMLHQSLCTWQPVILALCYPAYQTTAVKSFTQQKLHSREIIRRVFTRFSCPRFFKQKWISGKTCWRQTVGVACLLHSTEVDATVQRTLTPRYCGVNVLRCITLLRREFFVSPVDKWSLV